MMRLYVFRIRLPRGRYLEGGKLEELVLGELVH
jgi:hypothetical protein